VQGGAREERSPGRRSLKKYVLAFHKKIEATKTAIFTVAAALSRQDGMNRHSTSTKQSITMHRETVVTSFNDVFALSVLFPTSKTNKMGKFIPIHVPIYEIDHIKNIVDSRGNKKHIEKTNYL
jgi:hypothetical protein